MALTIGVSNCTQSGSNSDSTTFNVTLPAYSNGDLIIVLVDMWQDNNLTTTVTWPSAPDSETVNSLTTGYGAGSGNYDGANIGFCWYIATDDYIGGSWGVTVSDSTRFDASVIRVDAGTFDATTPISTAYDTKSDSANTSSPGFDAFSASSTDGNGGGKLMAFVAVDQDPISGTPSGWTDFVDHDQGRCSIVLSGRDAAVTNSESIGASNWTIAGDAWACYAFIIRGVVLDILVDSVTPTGTVKWDDTGIVIGGFGFNATKSTGKVEIWSDEVGTIKVEQSTTAWADDEITFSLDDQGTIGTASEFYVVVTSSDPYVSDPWLLYTITLDTVAPIYGEWDDTGIVLSGSGFNATKSTGKVELWSDASGTIKVEQSTTAWADDEITFSLDDQGTLPSEGAVFIVVTSSDPNESPSVSFYTGLPYYLHVDSLNPDIYHRFEGNTDDYYGTYAADGGPGDTTGTWTWPTTPITSSNTRCWKPAGNNVTLEMANTTFTNSTGDRTIRFIGGWIQLDRIYMTPSTIWEEGGGVNNFYFAVGFGNTIFYNGVDDGAWNVQAFSDIKLTVGRPYHLLIHFEGTGYGSCLKGYLNGIEVSVSAGIQPNQATMVSHSGGWTYCRADKNLDTGGTDIVYDGAGESLWSDWATWSDIGLSDTPLTSTEIRSLFVMGVIATDVINKDTEVNMQTAVDAVAPYDYEDQPCALKIDAVSGGGDFELTFDAITFDDRTDIHVLWMGVTGDELTIINLNGSNCASANCETPLGGTVTVTTPYVVTVSGAEDGSRIVVLDYSDNSILGSIASSSGDFEVTPQVSSINIMVIHDDYVIVRKENLSVTSDLFVPISQDTDYTYED